MHYNTIHYLAVDHATSIVTQPPKYVGDIPRGKAVAYDLRYI